MSTGGQGIGSDVGPCPCGGRVRVTACIHEGERLASDGVMRPVFRVTTKCDRCSASWVSGSPPDRT